MSTMERDTEIRNRFAGDVHQAACGELITWAATPRGYLALVITLDQFPRHIYRSTSNAFAYDGQALELCLAGLEQEIDLELTMVERVFFYTPLQHAENAAAQTLSVNKTGAMRSNVSPPLRKFIHSSYRYALEHKGIIDRFGRFPHRNAILGRRSTSDEESYINEGGSTFGQS